MDGALTPARRSRRAWITLLVVVATSLVVDLVSKHLAFKHIADEPVVLTREDILANTHARPEGGVYLNMTALIPPDLEAVTVVPKVLELTLVLNPGAVFGIGAGKRWVFVAFTGLALGFALWIFGAKTHARQWLPHLAIGLLIGGGLGNLYDRLVFACVRDFLHPLPGVKFPFGLAWPSGGREVWPYVSNIADLFLLIGIGLLMWHIWRSDPPGKKGEASSEEKGKKKADA